MKHWFFGIPVFLIAVSCNGCHDSQTVFSASDGHIDVFFPIETEGLRIMHITDSHVTVPSDDDSLVWNYCVRMHKAYEHTSSHVSGKDIGRMEAFEQLIDKAVREKVDLLALSGDIINFPSESAVAFIHDKLESSGIPYVYTAGNHDWHLEGMERTSEELREKYFSVLSPLYGKGKDPLCHSVVMNGINVVCIDNSTYQINGKQLEFFRNELSKGYPVILVMHIPVYSAGNGNGTMADPEWGAGKDTGYELERRQRWSEDGNNPETIEFRNLIMESDNMIILSGHIHKNRIDSNGGLIQFTSNIGRDGYCSIVDIYGM